MAARFRPHHPLADMLERTHHMRKIEQCVSGREVMFALWIAVSVHQEAWIHSRTIHGRISPRNVCIPHNFTIADALTDARVYLHAHPASHEPADPRFQSVMALSRPILKRKKPDLPLDYLDDLESFWYVLAWVYLAVGAPGAAPGRNISDPNKYGGARLALEPWAARPTSRESVLEKESMLMGQGLHPSASSSFFLSFIFNQVLDRLHAVLRHRYLLKLELGRPRTMKELVADSEGDYHAFLEALSDAIAYMDYMDACMLKDVNAFRGSHILIGKHIFLDEEFEPARGKERGGEVIDGFEMSSNSYFAYCSTECEEECLCMNQIIAEKLRGTLRARKIS